MEMFYTINRKVFALLFLASVCSADILRKSTIPYSGTGDYRQGIIYVDTPTVNSEAVNKGYLTQAGSSVTYADNAGTVGGFPYDAFVSTMGDTMNGTLFISSSIEGKGSNLDFKYKTSARFYFQDVSATDPVFHLEENSALIRTFLRVYPTFGSSSYLGLSNNGLTWDVLGLEGDYDANIDYSGANSRIDISTNVKMNGSLEVTGNTTITGGKLTLSGGGDNLLACDIIELTSGGYIYTPKIFTYGSMTIQTPEEKTLVTYDTIYGVNFSTSVAITGMKTGTTQANAGAGEGELWADSDDDYTIKLGQ